MAGMEFVETDYQQMSIVGTLEIEDKAIAKCRVKIEFNDFREMATPSPGRGSCRWDRWHCCHSPIDLAHWCGQLLLWRPGDCWNCQVIYSSTS